MWQKLCSHLPLYFFYLCRAAREGVLSQTQKTVPGGSSPVRVWLTAGLKGCNLVSDRFRAATRGGRSQLPGQLPNKRPHTSEQEQRGTRPMSMTTKIPNTPSSRARCSMKGADVVMWCCSRGGSVMWRMWERDNGHSKTGGILWDPQQSFLIALISVSPFPVSWNQRDNTSIPRRGL